MVSSLQADKLIFLSLVLAFAFSPYSAIGEDKILSLRDLKVGMKGIGKTVIHGRKIETFNVEVLGILSNNKINEKLLINGKSILVKVSGKVIDDAGGIAAGMSGSPIYIDGKLVGGLSSGWVMTDHSVGMVTPIEEMLEIWEYPTVTWNPFSPNIPELWTSPTDILLNGNPTRKFWVTDETQDLGKIQPSELIFLRAASPVYFQGLSGKAAQYLKKRWKSRNLQAEPAPRIPGIPIFPSSLHEENATYTIEPGSAIVVQLARGDINLSTLGTLTYMEGKKILAFAHPFLKKGNVSYLLTAAHIYHSFSSVQMPFKIGAPTEILGIITQDRDKGISGEIGRFPVMIPVHIDVTDKDLKRNRSINFQVVKDPAVILEVIESTFMQGLEGVIDRTGAGTAKLGIVLECMSASGAKFEFRREDMFYSHGEILNTLLDEINKVLTMVTESDIEEVYPTKINCRIEIEQRRRTMSIEKVEVKNTSITPGGVLEVWVTLRPFREKSVVRKAKIPIPNDIGREDLRLTVFGLTNRQEESANAANESQEGKRTKETKADEPVHESFEAMMRKWALSPQNSDLLFQLSLSGDEEKKIKLDGKDLEIQPTNLVVLGSIDSTITLSED